MAIANRDAVTLERPGVSALGETMYFAFGLEGVNNNTGFNTREDLLRTALHWAWDVPTVSVEVKKAPVGQVTQFTVTAGSTFDAKGVTYRWDFGDGSPFTNAYTSRTVGHVYEKPGTYTVRVEVTNELGAKTIYTFQVRIGIATFLPLIYK